MDIARYIERCNHDDTKYTGEHIEDDLEELILNTSGADRELLGLLIQDEREVQIMNIINQEDGDDKSAPGQRNIAVAMCV